MTTTHFLQLIVHALLLSILLASSHAILKWVSIQAHQDYSQLIYEQWKAVLLSLIIYGLVFFYYIVVLRSSPISLLYPVYTGMSVVMIMAMGRLYFDEPFGIYQYAGTMCILIGILLIGTSSNT
jgi:small multidrug resistance pump